MGDSEIGEDETSDVSPDDMRKKSSGGEGNRTGPLVDSSRPGFRKQPMAQDTEPPVEMLLGPELARNQKTTVDS